MVTRIILLALVVIAIIGVYGNLFPQGNMDATFDNLHTSVTTLAYAGEFDVIRTSVNEFIQLRTIYETDEGKLLAKQLDEKLNNLELVKIYCEQEISTLDLVKERNPYFKLQKICPKLENISFSKAADLFRLI